MNLNINKKYKIDWITHKVCLHNENDTLVNELAMESIELLVSIFFTEMSNEKVIYSFDYQFK